MRRKSIIFTAAAMLPLGSFAQTAETDTVKSQQLEEVVVEGALQSASATMTTYIPTKKVKSASQNAIDLLQRMNIPLLKANAVGETVTTAGGDEVAIFINYMEAESQDLLGLRTAMSRRWNTLISRQIRASRGSGT